MSFPQVAGSSAGVVVSKGVVSKGSDISIREGLWHLALDGQRTACGLSFDEAEGGATPHEASVTCQACRADWMRLTPDHRWTPFSVSDKAGDRAAARKMHEIALARLEDTAELSLRDAAALLELMNPVVDNTGRSLFDKSAADIPGLTTDSLRALRGSVAAQRDAVAKRQDVVMDLLNTYGDTDYFDVRWAESLLDQMSSTEPFYRLNSNPYYEVEAELPAPESEAELPTAESDAGD